MNGYDLSRNWFDFKFENPDKCRSVHSELFLYIVDLWNRLGQKEKFGLPTTNTMEILKIGSKKTYLKTFNELVEFGFIRVISDSKNQYQSRVIAIVKKTPAKTPALALAQILALAPPSTPIDKQINKETKEQINKIEFEVFWNLYDYKKNAKKCKVLWNNFSLDLQEQILKHVPNYIASTPDKKFRKHPATYFSSEAWNDEVGSTVSTIQKYELKHADEKW